MRITLTANCLLLGGCNYVTPDELPSDSYCAVKEGNSIWADYPKLEQFEIDVIEQQGKQEAMLKAVVNGARYDTKSHQPLCWRRTVASRGHAYNCCYFCPDIPNKTDLSAFMSNLRDSLNLPIQYGRLHSRFSFCYYKANNDMFVSIRLDDVHVEKIVESFKIRGSQSSSLLKMKNPPAKRKRKAPSGATLNSFTDGPLNELNVDDVKGQLGDDETLDNNEILSALEEYNGK